jgi:hypothetical protein
MKKTLGSFTIFLMLFSFIVLFSSTGCSDNQITVDTEEDYSLFVVVERELLYGYNYKVVYHKDTKVMYALSNQNVFTVMIDAEGKPLLWEEN